MFCSIFAITRRRVQMLVEKLKDGKSAVDLRGKHSNRPHKIADETRIMIKKHIESFPSQESHYSRNSSKKQCLQPDLNVNKMFALFQTKYPNVNVKLHIYREIFRGDHNLRFGVPRSDTCKTCDKLYIKRIAAETDEERKQIEIESELHHRKSEKAYATLKLNEDAAKVNSNLVVLAVDLQQVVFTPNLTHSDIYYQRQYSNYNFCIHNLGTSQVTMNVWHETLAKRGSTEIASCILKYIVNNYLRLKPGEDRKLIIWSDRCVGQNNN